jgi:hypothetical protein
VAAAVMHVPRAEQQGPSEVQSKRGSRHRQDRKGPGGERDEGVNRKEWHSRPVKGIMRGDFSVRSHRLERG